jgi:hypothetical protein
MDKSCVNMDTSISSTLLCPPNKFAHTRNVHYAAHRLLVIHANTCLLPMASRFTTTECDADRLCHMFDMNRRDRERVSDRIER